MGHGNRVLLIIACIALAFTLGLALAINGFRQKNYLFAIIGTIISGAALVVLFLLALVAKGCC